MVNQKEIMDALSKKGYRITNVRKDIIDCLLDNKHGHTINEIVNHLSKKNEKINISSTYNTIEILVNEGFVEERVNHIDKSISYEMINLDKNHLHVWDINENKEHHLELPKEIIDAIQSLIKTKFNSELHNLKVDAYIKRKNRGKKNE